MKSTPPPPTAAPSGPSRLGRWSVGAKIGGGGMATVYVGTSAVPGGGRELAALKVIRDEYVAEEHYVAMFLDEAKILSRMSHPHLIRTHEYGTQGRHCFIAMELLSGRSLADLWDRCAAVGLPDEEGRRLRTGRGIRDFSARVTAARAGPAPGPPPACRHRTDCHRTTPCNAH